MKSKPDLRNDVVTLKHKLEAAEHDLVIVKRFAGIRKAKACENFFDVWVARMMHTENKTRATILEWYAHDNKLQALSDRISGNIIEVKKDAGEGYFELYDNDFIIHESMIEFI